MNRKLIALTLAAATLAGAVSAQGAASRFAFDDEIARSSYLNLGTVTAAADGVVEIFDADGTFLGSAEVHQGANTDVRVDVGHPPVTDVRAELKIGGTVVATQDFDWAR